MVELYCKVTIGYNPTCEASTCGVPSNPCVSPPEYAPPWIQTITGRPALGALGAYTFRHRQSSGEVWHSGPSHGRS